MGLLNFFAKPAQPPPGLPSGCFTVDRTGRVVIGTVPSSFPAATITDIARHVLDTFREAQAAQLPLAELVVHFGSLKITAREQRGGALVFLAPRTLTSSAK
ncbi:MAG: hypothetical protein EXS35_13380 [Pedosphaera sp.]|nr:hypothetical protein [Pedosphaera sp.]